MLRLGACQFGRDARSQMSTLPESALGWRIQRAKQMLYNTRRHKNKLGCNPFRTEVPFWRQTTQSPSSLSPKRDRSPKSFKNFPHLGQIDDDLSDLSTVDHLVHHFSLRDAVQDLHIAHMPPLEHVLQ